MNELELTKEKDYLSKTAKYLNEKIEELEKTIFKSEKDLREFKKYTWENKSGMDKQELIAVTTDNELEAGLLLNKSAYYKKLLKIKNSPYFASITLQDNDKLQKIYIGMTYLYDENLDHLIYDWRAPISSIFYDYEKGECHYEAPEGIISTYLENKRQYKIEKQELLRVVDSSLNINDDILQEVLANTTNDKMKNIVNTIQQEQNEVIRNTKDKNLIVQGIAGSGKTSVALHRIAFLLYKIKNLTSDKIIIFSPNNIFTEYISDVLPDLGEENTLQTTFHDYLKKMCKEYKSVESYSNFLNKYYIGRYRNKELMKYKQSDAIISDLENFVKYFEENVRFKKGFIENKVFDYSKEELNELFKYRYASLPFFTRIEEMALKFSENNYNGKKTKKSVYHKLLLEAMDLKKDYKALLELFYKSQFFKQSVTEEDLKSLHNKEIKYDDALLLVYLKGLMEGFYYEPNILQIVIDEAQDYSYLQYLILSKVFKKASFTILGDVNQNINPFYSYNSLDILLNLFPGKYVELNKTYRSSEEIIEFANSILDLNHICAIRKNVNKPVLKRNSKETLKGDITNLKQNYNSLAIIVKNEELASRLYEELKDSFNLSNIDSNTNEFIHDFVIIPAYLAKGLEFDTVIVYQDKINYFTEEEKRLFYVAVTRAQHELILYNIS
ncbi:MAG: AAA family ATPase [Bacilli bacterium]|nr:AAA family ATPase [Bacilli bacterium]